MVSITESIQTLSHLVKPVVSYGGSRQLLFVAGANVGALYGTGVVTGVITEAPLFIIEVG